ACTRSAGTDIRRRVARDAIHCRVGETVGRPARRGQIDEIAAGIVTELSPLAFVCSSVDEASGSVAGKTSDAADGIGDARQETIGTVSDACCARAPDANCNDTQAAARVICKGGGFKTTGLVLNNSSLCV